MARPKHFTPAPTGIIQATPETLPAGVNVPEVLSAPPDAQALRGDTEMKRITRYEKMRLYFEERPRVSVRIRKEDGDQEVRINGYGFQIKAGERVMVPVDVATILQDAGLA